MFGLTGDTPVFGIPGYPVSAIVAFEIFAGHLLRSLVSIENTVVITGSHDNTLDLLADQIRLEHPGIGISSSHVGSIGGLMAI